MALFDDFAQAGATSGLSTRTSNSGHSWSTHPNSPGTDGSRTGTSAGSAYAFDSNNTGPNWWLSSWVPSSADYYLFAETRRWIGAIGPMGLLVRADPSATTFYRVTMNASTFLLDKVVSGTTTNLVTISSSFFNGLFFRDFYIETRNEGSDVRIIVRVINPGTGDHMNSSGGTSASPVDAVNYLDTSSPITAAGRVGMAMPGSPSQGQGFWYYTIEADNFAGVINEDVIDNLNFVDDVELFGNEILESVEQDLVLDDGASGDFTLGLFDNLDFGEVIIAFTQRDREPVEDELGLTDEVFLPSHPQMQQDLGLTDEVTEQLLTIFGFPQTLNLNQTVNAFIGVPWVPIPLTDELNLTDKVGRVYPFSISQSIVFTDSHQWSYGFEDFLSLADSSSAARGFSASNTLQLTDAADPSGNWLRDALSSLELSQVYVGYRAGDKCLLRGQRVHGVQRLKLTFSGETIELKNPETDNSYRLGFSRVVREGRGGELFVYRDPNWPKIYTLLYTIVGKKQSELERYEEFIRGSLGQMIHVEDWLGDSWLGIITNPDELKTEDNEGFWTLTFQVDCQRLPGEVQNLSLSQAVEVTLQSP